MSPKLLRKPTLSSTQVNHSDSDPLASDWFQNLGLCQSVHDIILEPAVGPAMSLIRLTVSTFVQLLEEKLSNKEAFCSRMDGSHLLTTSEASLNKKPPVRD